MTDPAVGTVATGFRALWMRARAWWRRRIMRHVQFDQGIGPEGRDWEWDYSLRGPISVRFRGVCKTKSNRQ